ncbi:phosphatase PAP2 family protein [Desulfothermobacter acidiphilus]|uniref:phosphatase PAP2 family protein n=1 Tax=Desulfothermobacter acidiphilus TaxID=1938353 RepID=UPI003F8CF06B
MLETLLHMDAQAFTFINGLAGKNLVADQVFRVLALFGPLFFGVYLLLLWVKGQEADRYQVMKAVLAAALGLLFNQCIGWAFYRPRPFTALPTHLLVPPTSDASFPSDHATGSFALALSFCGLARWLGLALAVLVAFARVYVGAHYPLDVLGGAVIGSLAAWAVDFTSRRWALLDRCLALPVRLYQHLLERG